jgi:hypothetical protein
MDYRWVFGIVLWTVLSGPVLQPLTLRAPAGGPSADRDGLTGRGSAHGQRCSQARSTASICSVSTGLDR